jgi:hypothetical protein
MQKSISGFACVAIAIFTASANAGVVSVCDEVHLKQQLSSGGAITFDCNGTITFAGGPATIAVNTNIDGTGHNIVIAGIGYQDIFDVPNGISFGLTNLNVTGKTNPLDNSSAINSQGGKVVLSGVEFLGSGRVSMNGGTLTAVNCSFSGFREEPFSDGSIDAHDSTIIIHDSSFSGNSNALNAIGSGVDIDSSNFAFNYIGIQTFGGALYVANSTFWANSVGISFGSFRSVPQTFAWIAHNTFAAGGVSEAKFVDNEFPNNNNVTVVNSIFDGVAGSCLGVTDGGGNLQHPAGACVGSVGDPKLQLQSSALSAGVALVAALTLGSAAIDTALDTFCTFYDQRGVTRPQGAHCDIGAFEASMAISQTQSVEAELTGFLAGLQTASGPSKRLQGLLQLLTSSLNPELWQGSDGNHLNPLQGATVFKLHEQVVTSLSELIIDQTQVSYITSIVQADRMLASTALSDAHCSTGPVTDSPAPSASCSKALSDFAAGDVSLKAGDGAGAIDQYGSAWSRLN